MKIRIKFAKSGSMKFIGHLDIMRYFQKAMRRADVDIAYSEGFSPHQKMSFAAPLGVGLTSRGEYFDIEVHSTDTSAEMLQRLNNAMVEGIEVLSYRLLPENSKNAMSLVAAADYFVRFREGYKPDIDINGAFHEFMAQKSIEIVKTTKKSEKTVDIQPMILEYEVREDGIFLKLAAGSENNLKPELVMKSFYEYM
ncbi:MAG: TIGR03936 family radical SAM-associated protein, partial [Lachnospiraceae bacterium]|nr:TIGR03936 family radical SAM-associated protein [Lachnospiraceae bacterium]